MNSQLSSTMQNNVIHVSTGQCGMGAVTEDGELYIWGQSFAMGALRTGNHTFDLPQNAPLPRKALFFSRFIVRSVACGQETMGAIVDGVQKKQGLVYMWGKSRNGACGSGMCSSQ